MGIIMAVVTDIHLSISMLIIVTPITIIISKQEIPLIQLTTILKMAISKRLAKEDQDLPLHRIPEAQIELQQPIELQQTHLLHKLIELQIPIDHQVRIKLQIPIDHQVLIELQPVHQNLIGQHPLVTLIGHRHRDQWDHPDLLVQLVQEGEEEDKFQILLPNKKEAVSLKRPLFY